MKHVESNECASWCALVQRPVVVEVFYFEEALFEVTTIGVGNVTPDKPDDGPLTLERVSKSAAREAEERMIRAALETTNGNKTRAAENLGVSYKTLLTKIKDYEIK